MNSVLRVATVVTVVTGVTVAGHAIAAGYHCALHPQLPSCDDPRLPPPELPDQIPTVTQMSSAKSTTVISTTVPSTTVISTTAPST